MRVEKKIFCAQALRTQCNTWRRADKRIVFTNGCFDLLHAGHIFLLEEAKKHGDKLIVAVNSDKSVRHLKGSARPIAPLYSRAVLLAALSLTDAVISFEEETPEKLITYLKPHVLVKGGDYKPEEIAGANFIQSIQGKVVIISLLCDYSTSSYVEKIHCTNTKNNSL